MKKWNIGWGVISSCTMKCQFCYSYSRRSECKELGLEEWIRFVDSNHERINSINYGTSENTLSRDWFKLIMHIRSKYPAIRQAITTNGYLSIAIKDPECKAAFIAAIDEVDISLDFADKKCHGVLRGQPSAYDWAIETLKLCREYQKPSTIVFLGSKVNLTRENIDGLFAIGSKYGTMLRMNIFRPAEGLNEKTALFIPDGKIIEDTIRYIAEKYSVAAINDPLFSSILANTPTVDPSGDCSIRILPNGNITPSTYLIREEHVVANIRDENVLEKLEKDHSLETIIKPKLPCECMNCVYANSCRGGVYDRRILWCGTLDRRDPYCPHSFSEKNSQPVPLGKTPVNSVHDGYLPTIFFSPTHN